jgi:hypothetical protein
LVNLAERRLVNIETQPKLKTLILEDKQRSDEKPLASGRLAGRVANPVFGQEWRLFGVAASIWSLAFFAPLFRVAKLALSTDVHSHLLLIPLVSAYVLWVDRE